MVESTLHRVHTDFNATLCSKYEQKKRFKDRLFKILASYNGITWVLWVETEVALMKMPL